MKIFSVLVLWVLASSVQAGDRRDGLSSEALQVVRAAHFEKARDVTAQELQAAKEKQQKNAKLGGSPTAMAAIGAGTATGVFSAPRGMSRDTASILGFASAIFANLPVGYPEVSSRVIAFMPKELAATPQDARDLMRKTLLTAIQESVPEAHVELVLAPPKSTVQSYVAIQGSGVDCRIYSQALEEKVVPVVQQAPAFLGGGEVYAWGHPTRQGNGLVSVTGSSLTPDQLQVFLLDVSSHLPRWAYLYLPRSVQFAQYPQVLSQGEVLRFVEPGAESLLLTDSAAPSN